MGNPHTREFTNHSHSHCDPWKKAMPAFDPLSKCLPLRWWLAAPRTAVSILDDPAKSLITLHANTNKTSAHGNCGTNKVWKKTKATAKKM